MDKMVMLIPMAETFRNETYMYEVHFKPNPDLLGVVVTHSPVASLFWWFYKVKWSKLPMLRGVPGALPDVLRRIPLQGKSEYVQILMLWSQIRFVPPQVLSGASWLTPFFATSWQEKNCQFES